MSKDKPEKPDFVKREEEILAYWKARDVFKETLEKDAPHGEFVFYDGPPFATGLPHAGSLLSSVSKDVIPRYKTMRGYKVRRRWGWDCHGLPIESLVEQKLGLKNKKDILDVGIGPFNEAAREMVMQYANDWKQYVERVGRWVDFDNSYKTMDATYMESVWWALKRIHEAGRLYEGRKVLMYCPHCETPLAKAEIAMDNTYKDVTEEAVTVKFKVKNPSEHGFPENTFFLAWTTTPWTLPGNVALAVGPEILYALVSEGEQYFLLAKDLYKGGGVIQKEFVGKNLVGISYEPLYEIEKVSAHAGKKWEVLSADFVTTADGTGIVHSAVIYGEDDYALGLKEGLPMIPLLNPNGTYNDDAPESLRGKYIKKAEKEIKADLESRGLLYKKENNTHSYPHCYRCGAPLIYNAVSSWFINIQEVKEKMLSQNEKVTWVPEHLKHGRFKHIMESAPDWTISRNRFWATPLPIWKKKSGEPVVIGSLEDLRKYTKKSGNQYFVMRHGQSEHNTLSTISARADDPHTLTEKGREEVVLSAEALRKKGIQKIIVSPFTRTRDTAELVRKTLGMSEDVLTVDKRLSEIDLSPLNGQSIGVYYVHAPSYEGRFAWRPEGGENLTDVKTRVGEFLYELEKNYTNTKFLLVTHEYTGWMIQTVAKGLDQKQSIEFRGTGEDFPNTGEVVELDFVPLPHNAKYELDLHRPYIDDVALVDEQGEPMVRIPEVVDCWVESASMPFAEYHYPFENKEAFEDRSPGDFIAEYIAQTRTWFYYMHTISVLLFNRLAFRNVLTTGTVLAADGSKMSKSKGNYTDPLVNVDAFGADAFRFYLMSSVVMQAEDFSFKDEELREAHSRVLNILRNTVSFYDLYKEFAPKASGKSHHVLDRWVIARLSETRETVTDSLDHFDTVKATRAVRSFIDDFSTWYVRRSRDRVKSDDEKERELALATLRYVFAEFSKIIAPIMPFLAEHIWWAVKDDSDPHSVHLASWPESIGKVDEVILADMVEVRKLVTVALEARSKAGIKVRQPLQRLEVSSVLLEGKEELLSLIKDELNVKEVVVVAGLVDTVHLDTVISPELRREGSVRELVRAIQDLRKGAGLTAGARAHIVVDTDVAGKAFLESIKVEVQKTASLSDITYANLEVEKVVINEFLFGLSLK